MASPFFAEALLPPLPAGGSRADAPPEVGISPSSPPGSTQVDPDSLRSSPNAPYSDANIQGQQETRAPEVPVLKIGGKAEHPTLGTVTIIHFGSLGAKIEFFSVRARSLKTRQVLLADLTPLADEEIDHPVADADSPVTDDSEDM